MSLKLWAKLLRHSALNVYLNLTHYTAFCCHRAKGFDRTRSPWKRVEWSTHTSPVAKRNGNTRWRAKPARIDQPSTYAFFINAYFDAFADRRPAFPEGRLRSTSKRHCKQKHASFRSYAIFLSVQNILNTHIHEDKSLIIDYENYFSMKHKGKPTHSHINERVNWSYL